MFRVKKLLGMLFRWPNVELSVVAAKRVPLKVEALEQRCCPAGTWVWSGPAGAVSNWINNTQGVDAWVWNGVAVNGLYPGMPGSANDVVEFNNPAMGPCVLNTAALPQNLAPIQTLEITGWNDILSVQSPLKVTGSGDFKLTDTSSVNLAANTTLTLQALTGPNSWTSGTIQGAAGSSLAIQGTVYNISGAPTFLGTNMSIGGAINNNIVIPGVVKLNNMTTNLVLNGATTYVEVDANGSLMLLQQIGANVQPNTQGGIEFANGHNAKDVAVYVEAQGTLYRGSTPVVGVADQVVIQGPVYNEGGSVAVSQGAMLNITGVDTNDFSYWQDTSGSFLTIEAGSNITAAGTYEIDEGTVQLDAPNGSTNDAVDGQGMNFGSNNLTALNVVDSMPGTQGTVQIYGGLSLGLQTTLSVSYSSANNKADLLDVLWGDLKLRGTLDLTNSDGNNNKPGKKLAFLDDEGTGPSITGAFASFQGSIPGAIYTPAVDNTDPAVYYYNVTIA